MKIFQTLLQLFILGVLIVTFAFQISGARLQNQINRDLLMRVTALESCGCQGARDTGFVNETKSR